MKTARTARAPIVLVVALASACAHPAPLPAKAIELNRDGAAAIATGDLEVAEARIALALEYNPRFTEAWVNLGIVELRRGNFERAHRNFIRARDLNPDLPAPHHALGVLAESTGHFEDAENHYYAAIHVDPGFAPARINLARRLFERGALEEAREQFLRLTQVAPEVDAGWTGLCETLFRLDRSDEAEDVLAATRERFGRPPAVVLLEARLLLRTGSFAEAERRLVPVTRSPDRHQAAAAFAWQAIARLGQGDAIGAREAAERAASLQPSDGVARYALRRAREGLPADPVRRDRATFDGLGR